MVELLDRHLEPIAPAMMLPGDIYSAPAEVGDEDDGFGETIGVSLGQKVWGWSPDADKLEVLIIDPIFFTRAWRA